MQIPEMTIDKGNLRETVTNAKEILDAIKTTFPSASITSLAKIANVSQATVTRWRREGRADRQYFHHVCDYYTNLMVDDLDVPLSGASIRQIKQRIAEIGYKRFYETEHYPETMQ